MELSESVQRGMRLLACPSSVDQRSFQELVEVCFRSLVSSQGDATVLDQPELKSIDRVQLKQIHTAATTFILEGVKQNADKSAVSSSLEELTFSPERIELFYNTYQKHKKELEGLLASIGRRPAQITDVSWRLQYNMKNKGTSEDIDFTCTMEQLQVKITGFKCKGRFIDLIVANFKRIPESLVRICCTKKSATA
uniref:COMM domain containing 3 n=1 Tax=Nothobranchius furzeri TaxID=105023 RepID=A0A8C6NS53_NOTFU